MNIEEQLTANTDTIESLQTHCTGIVSQVMVSSRLQQVNIEGEKPPPSLTHLPFCMLEIYSNMKTFKHIARVNMVHNRISSVSMLYNPFGLLIIKLKNKLQSDYKININDNWIVNTNKYNKKITNIVIPVQWFKTADSLVDILINQSLVYTGDTFCLSG